MNKNNSLIIVLFLAIYSIINTFIIKQGIALVTTLCLVLFWCFVIFLVKQKDKLNTYGVTLKKINDKSIIALIASIIIIPIANIVMGFNGSELSLLGFSKQNLIFQLIFIISCAFGEEIFFRGILLDFFTKKVSKPFLVILIVATLFSVTHIINLLSIANASYIIIQLVFAFSVGICSTTISYYTKSIIITFILHLLINLTSVNGLDFKLFYLIISVVFIALCLAILFRKEKANETIY